MKVCRLCSVEKEEGEFYSRSDCSLLRSECRRCTNKTNKAWRERNAEKNRRYIREWRIKKYGISKKEYEDMLLSQGGVCAICGKGNGDKSMCIDHCHTTKKVRGLLCIKCNLMLGQSGDSIGVLANSIIYLDKNSK